MTNSTEFTETISNEQLISFTETERNLGVGLNRENATLSVGENGELTAAYVRPGVSIVINLEKDQELQNLLKKIKGHTKNITDPMQKVQDSIALVVLFTPMSTEAESQQRRGALGEFLDNPDAVECIDRALAMEAVLKQTGVVEEAAILTSSDSATASGEHLGNHADVTFTFKNSDTEYVAITTGDQAGAIMTREVYLRDYIGQREAAGLGTRKITGRELPYFLEVH
jgi:hypothetical protein